jgi:hypothetical protein
MVTLFHTIPHRSTHYHTLDPKTLLILQRGLGLLTPDSHYLRHNPISIHTTMTITAPTVITPTHSTRSFSIISVSPWPRMSLCNKGEAYTFLWESFVSQKSL